MQPVPTQPIWRQERHQTNLPAFCQLDEQYGAYLLAYIRRLVNNRVEAEDLVQDTWVKAWHNLHRYDPALGSPATWLLKIAHNTAVSQLRKKRIVADSLQPGWDYTQAVLPDYSGIGLRELAQRVLPLTYWQVIDLVYFQGYTLAEVAQRLNAPLGTVKTRCRGALRLLKNYVG